MKNFTDKAPTEAHPYGYIIKPDGTVDQMPEPANGDEGFSLEQLQTAVGGYIEPVYSPVADAADKALLADEEGLIKQLEPNPAASILAARPIVGNLVVLPRELFE